MISAQAMILREVRLNIYVAPCLGRSVGSSC